MIAEFLRWFVSLIVSLLQALALMALAVVLIAGALSIASAWRLWNRKRTGKREW